MRSDPAASHLIPPLAEGEIRKLVGFVSDIRRGNVAISRVKQHLVIVCDPTTIRFAEYFGDLIDYTAVQHGIIANVHEVNK